MDALIESAIDSALRRAAGARTVWIGYSGGMDSTLLLHGAAAIARQRVAAIHIDHGLDPQSALWNAHCQRQAEALGVRFETRRVHIDVGANLEARARAARYAVFRDMLEEGDVLLLAHHADDQLETMLLHLLRGADTGRLGMPVERSIGGGHLLRPLLAFERDQLAAAAIELDLQWIEDPSNAALHADRNYLRHRIMPVLRQRWPDSATRAARSAARAQIDVQIAIAALDAELGDDVAQRAQLPVTMLVGDWAPRLLRRWLQRCGVDAVREAAIEEILAQLRRGSAVGVEVLPDVSVRRHRDALHVVVGAAAGYPAQSWDLRTPVPLPAGVVRARPQGQPAAVGEVTIEPWQGGERLQLAGRKGSRRVARLLQEHCIAAWQRPHYPLVFVGGELAVVPGIAVDARFADVFTTSSVSCEPCPKNDIWVIEYEAKTLARRAFRL